MQKFKTWLEANRGMAAQLRKTLKVNATVISNVKHGRMPMPYNWFQAVAELSGGAFAIEELYTHRVKNHGPRKHGAKFG